MSYLCWTCGKDYRCASEEHKYLKPHPHVEPVEIADEVELAKHKDHWIESEDYECEKVDAEAR